MVAAIFVVAMIAYSSYTGAGNTAKANDYEAKQICETAIKANLKSPSTAKFEHNVQILSTDENDYRIQAAVDSQNGFGATVRNDFTCKMTWSPSSKSWNLDRVSR